ncbi:MAG: response regulator [Lentisphaerae bacterium]|nr:MAG: response regulator [Lentisphaerota bacterium]
MYIVFIDDEKPILECMELLGPTVGWTVRCFDDPDRALFALQKDGQNPDFIFLDNHFPKTQHGAEFYARELRQLFPQTAIGLLTGDPEPFADASNAPWQFVVGKPFTVQDLKTIIETYAECNT